MIHPSIQTVHGHRLYDLRCPDPGDVSIFDVAHSLSLICRFNGHVREFYSVAQHCCLVSSHFAGRLEKLWALLHEAHETYVGDIMSPVAVLLPGLKDLKKRHQAVVYKAFQLMPPPPEVAAAIKEVDTRMLFTEKRDLFAETVNWGWDAEPYEQAIQPWSAETARRVFLETCRKLR